MIISHLDKDYNPPCENGANIYSQNICKFFIPNIDTDRNWVTVNIEKCLDHSIVFIHSNVGLPHKYDYLKKYKDLILICSQIKTAKALENYGHVEYLPLSVDVDYIKKFWVSNKDKSACYAGRYGKNGFSELERKRVDMLYNISHNELLHRMAYYHYVYAVGLTAIEAKVLGCNVLPYDSRYPVPSVWKVKACYEMIQPLQQIIRKYEHKV